MREKGESADEVEADGEGVDVVHLGQRDEREDMASYEDWGRRGVSEKPEERARQRTRKDDSCHPCERAREPQQVNEQRYPDLKVGREVDDFVLVVLARRRHLFKPRQLCAPRTLNRNAPRLAEPR